MSRKDVRTVRLSAEEGGFISFVKIRDINNDKDNYMRITGVDIPEKEPVWIALTRIYGIGRSNVQVILRSAKVESHKRAGELSSEEVAKLTSILAKYKTEGDLRKEVFDNIKRLKRIGAYRGLRHSKNLPVRGQRTRSNARTKRGKRVTIGAMRKKDLAKSEKVKKEKE